MRKTILFPCFIVGLILLFGACSKSESYADKVKKEKKAISRFFTEHDIVILREYPSDGVFEENEFYQDPSGIYYHVVDSGNGKHADDKTRSTVYFRFSGTYTLYPDPKDTLSLTELSSQPIEFRYGVPETYKNSDTKTIAYRFLSPGITIPLQHVGESAIVKIIVPFRGSMGSQFQTAANQPSTLYYGKLEYTKIIN